MQSYLDFSPEVICALEEKKPILALESTVITHGLPYPINQEVAIALETITRDHGVTPATIAIMNGRIKIGLSSTDLETLVHDQQCMKASRRDIAYVLANKLNAGTTVAATLYCAHQAGIKLFATGGIGGVHRGDSMDISADLIELSRTPIAVICAGAKAILDLPKTMEFLDTHSVPVIGYQTDYLPAFYTAATTYRLPMRIDTINALADLLRIQWQLGMTASTLIMNPIPTEDEIPATIIQPIIDEALQRAAQQHIAGKAITPFLLGEIANITAGKSQHANIQLIKNNVKLGAELAKAVH